MSYIDLHTHSTASDGSDTPSQLIAKAARLNLKSIALTDHDTLAGLDEGEKAAAAHGINFIRGCEISSRNHLGEFHILGLFAPKNNPALEHFISDAREHRIRRNELMIKKLQDLGIDITLEEITQQGSGPGGKPHMANILIKKGYVLDRGQAFNEFLGREGKAFVPKVSPLPENVVSALANSGATAVLAHPFLHPLPPGELEKMIKKLSACGLSALEVWHSSHNEGQSRYLKSVAKKFGLGMTGGSDYHGKAKPGIYLGTGYGNLQIPSKILDDLIDFRKTRGLPC